MVEAKRAYRLDVSPSPYQLIRILRPNSLE